MVYYPKQLPVIGIMQYVIMKIIESDPSKACWREISDRLTRYRDIDDAQVSVILFRLEGRGLIQAGEVIKNGEKGRPPKTYTLTTDGLLALRLADDLLRACK